MMKTIRSSWFIWTIALILLEVLSSCNCCKWRCCIPSGRRPQVMATSCPSVIDYACGEDVDEEMQKDALDARPCFLDGREITEEDLRPWIDVNSEFTISVGNQLEISLFGDEELDVEQAVIASDGNLYYSLLGPIPAAGRTTMQLVEDLTKELSKFYQNPIVAITPKYFPNQNFKILGRVRFPGLYDLHFPITLRDGIAIAGGIVTQELSFSESDTRYRSNADLENSFIVREGQKLNVDFQEVVFTPFSNQNIFLRPGDYIYIAPIDKQQVYVLGDLRRNRTIPYIHGLTLMGALASGAGWDIGNPYSPEITQVLVLRGSLECPKVIEVDVTEILYGCALDVFLASGDIVYVPNKTLRFGRELIRLAIDTFINSFGTAAGSYYANRFWFPPPHIDSDNTGSGATTTSTTTTTGSGSGKRFMR